MYGMPQSGVLYNLYMMWSIYKDPYLRRNIILYQKTNRCKTSINDETNLQALSNAFIPDTARDEWSMQN